MHALEYASRLSFLCGESFRPFSVRCVYKAAIYLHHKVLIQSYFLSVLNSNDVENRDKNIYREYKRAGTNFVTLFKNIASSRRLHFTLFPLSPCSAYPLFPRTFPLPTSHIFLVQRVVLHERKLHPSPDRTMSKVMHILQGDRISRLQCLDCRLGYDATSSDRNLSNFPRNELSQKKKTFGSIALKTT